MSTLRLLLVPVDFSRCSRAALAAAIQQCDGVATAIDVLYVASPVTSNLRIRDREQSHASLNDYMATNIRRDLDHLISSLRFRGTIRLAAMVEMGDPATAILEVARRKPYDRLFIGTHSRAPATKDAPPGSVAARVASEAECPVTTVRDVASRVAPANRPAPQPAWPWIALRTSAK